MNKNYEIDMCNGPIFNRIIIFALPLILSGILQLFFNAADIIVVGRFAGSQSLAAVGATSSLINLLINLFIGLSVGANVLLGRYIGAKEDKNASETVHTAIYTAFYGGILMILVGYLLSKPLLQLMGTPNDVINLSTIYMRIYFMGMPAFMVYNFGAALLRTVGDTRRPLYFLLIAGIVNIFLNLFTVIVLNMGVAGVALATISSQLVSAILVIQCLRNSKGVLKLKREYLKLHKDKFIQMIKIGLPAGLQGTIFSISNVIIQSSINSFGSTVVAGNTASSNIEGFIYTSMNAIYQTSLSFTSQNMGAKKYHRVDQILLQCLAIVAGVGIIFGFSVYFFSKPLLHIYSNDPNVIMAGVNRLGIMATTFFICGMMDVVVGSLRGMGFSITPMLVSLTGACLLRVVWVFTIFKIYPTLFTLYISYPISWLLTFIAHIICYLIIRRSVFNK